MPWLMSAVGVLLRRRQRRPRVPAFVPGPTATPEVELLNDGSDLLCNAGGDTIIQG